MSNFETRDSKESVANPSPLIDSIRSLVKFASVLVALLAISACNKNDNNSDSQAELRACQIDSAKLEGILSGLNVDRAQLKGDSDFLKNLDGGKLHACEVHKARLIGLSQGVGVNRQQLRLRLEAVGLGELALDVPYGSLEPDEKKKPRKTGAEVVGEAEKIIRAAEEKDHAETSKSIQKALEEARAAAKDNPNAVTEYETGEVVETKKEPKEKVDNTNVQPSAGVKKAPLGSQKAVDVEQLDAWRDNLPE